MLFQAHCLQSTPTLLPAFFQLFQIKSNVYLYLLPPEDEQQCTVGGFLMLGDLQQGAQKCDCF